MIAAFAVASMALIAWAVDGVAPDARGRAVGTISTALELGIALGGMIAGITVATLGFAPTFLGAAAVVLAAAALAAKRAARA